MKAFVQFVGLIVAALFAMALLAYPAWLAISPWLEEPRFHRVASRVGMLVLLVGFLLLARRLGLADRASLGYGAPRAVFLKQLARGLALGIALMLPVVAIMLALGLRIPRDGLAFGAATLAAMGVKALISALVVAAIEETFFRGAMFTAVARESGARRAILLTSLVYATMHFLARVRIPPEEVGWSSGFELLAGTLATLAVPWTIADAFICLFAVGVLLGTVRHLTGNIAACLGLHAGWVWVMLFARETTSPAPSAPLGFLLSAHDGFTGWLVLGWTVLTGTAVVAWYAAEARTIRRAREAEHLRSTR